MLAISIPFSFSARDLYDADKRLKTNDNIFAALSNPFWYGAY